MSFKGWDTEKVSKTIKKKISKTQAYNILESIGDMIVRDTVKRMTSDQVKPKTKSSTLAARRYLPANKRNSKYPAGITLVAKGDLVDSITRKVFISKKRVRIGTNLEYARIHQFGGRTGRNKRTKIPARPYLFFSGVNMINIRRMIAKAFNS
jgi:phage gpG-like protein